MSCRHRSIADRIEHEPTARWVPDGASEQPALSLVQCPDCYTVFPAVAVEGNQPT